MLETRHREGAAAPMVRNTTIADELLIVGAGIAGLTAALVLARAGRRVRVLEQATEFTELGAGLQLAPNATRVLDGLGLLPEALKSAVVPRRLVLRNAISGEELTSLELGDFDRRYGAPYIAMHRSDLLDILVDACRAETGVTLETGESVTSVRSAGDHVEVTCADGSTTWSAGLIGADGVHSTVRLLVSDDELIGSGYVAYRGAVPLAEVDDVADLHDAVAWIGPGLHLVQYALRRGELYNQVAVFRSDRYAAGHDDWGSPDELDERFAATCDRVRAALPALWRDRRWPLYDRAPIDNWSTGRITLIGDAAHPMLQYLAQGACQAIEDAASLADAISAHPTDIATAFRAYQSERIPRTARVQRNARTWGDIWHIDGVGMLVRDTLLRQRAIDDHRHIEWLYSRPRKDRHDQLWTRSPWAAAG